MRHTRFSSYATGNYLTSGYGFTGYGLIIASPLIRYSIIIAITFIITAHARLMTLYFVDFPELTAIGHVHTPPARISRS
jgi:hypothetical protein